MPLKTSLFLLFLGFSCNAQPPAPAFNPEGKQVYFLDSLEASVRVSRDREEGFFDQIGSLDMGIQMQQSAPPTVEDYREFLREDVRNFTAEEKETLEGQLKTIYGLFEKISPFLSPDTLRLIKTRGAYYGPGAWFTREDCIVIPEDALRGSSMQEVLLHELFHVLSRKHPVFRRGLYELIGFTRLEEPVIIPEALSRRLLLNPDGMDRQWAVFLTGKGSTAIPVIPLIFSRYASFDPRRPQFFAHMDFGLFSLKKDTLAGAFVVQVSPEGNSTLGEDFRMDYLRKVKDNTNYLIHPDEILADNFIWAVRGPARWRGFSPGGRSLLEAMVGFIKNWKGD